MSIKQVIVIRKDLKMRRGKECAQAAHASMKWLVDRWYRGILEMMSREEREWLVGSFTKICVKVNSEEELLEVYNKAREKKLEAHLIKDSGKTEFKEPTLTCCAIGPDREEKIDEITGNLTLY